MLLKNFNVKFTLIILFSSLMLFLPAGCHKSYSPKPRGYFRIELPPKAYRAFDSIFPYRFEYPAYANIVPKTDSMAEPYWINIEFPQFKGTLHLSYKPLDGNLRECLEDSRELVNKHIQKASGIDEILIIHKEQKVYGTFFDIRGNAAASPYQFYLTDSLHHFVRGALYFFVSPNNDSLAPVIDFIKADLDRLINTFSWSDHHASLKSKPVK